MQRFETPATHRLGDGLMGAVWQMILPASLLIVFGLSGGLIQALHLPDPGFAISMVFVAVLLLYTWARVGMRMLRSSAGWGMDLHTDHVQLGSRAVPYDDVRTISVLPLNLEKPNGDLGLRIGIGDRLRESRVVLSHPDGLAGFDALRARCPGAVATDLEGVDHEPEDPQARAEALAGLGRRRVVESIKWVVIGVVVTAWGGLLVVLVLLNDEKPLADKLEAFLTGIGLLVAGIGWVAASVLGWQKAKANLADAAA